MLFLDYSKDNLLEIHSLFLPKALTFVSKESLLSSFLSALISWSFKKVQTKMCGEMIEKTTEKNDIIHNMAESSPGRQKNGTTRADLLLRLHNLWEAVPFLNHHPIR